MDKIQKVLIKQGRSDLAQIYYNKISSNYAKDIVKGTDLDFNVMNKISEALRRYFDQGKTKIVIDTQRGENKNMSVMELLYKRLMKKINESGRFDKKELEIMKKNFLKIKPKGNWHLVEEISSKSKKPYHVYMNYVEK